METCNNMCITLMQRILEIGTKRAMENRGKTLHELATHVPKKTAEGGR
jgi:hypothetical protein